MFSPDFYFYWHLPISTFCYLIDDDVPRHPSFPFFLSFTILMEVSVLIFMIAWILECYCFHFSRNHKSIEAQDETNCSAKGKDTTLQWRARLPLGWHCLHWFYWIHCFLVYSPLLLDIFAHIALLLGYGPYVACWAKHRRRPHFARVPHQILKQYLLDLTILAIESKYGYMWTILAWLKLLAIESEYMAIFAFCN